MYLIVFSDRPKQVEFHSIDHDQFSDDFNCENDITVLKPTHIKTFKEEVLALEILTNKEHILYALQTQILIY